ncbi:hypothetical protein D0B32_24495 [Paraburkholderia sp. DHOC27]|nr:hypothetical protein D0B32_24495 [Paraburkholderia sp. DHOC27]
MTPAPAKGVANDAACVVADCEAEFAATGGMDATGGIAADEVAGATGGTGAVAATGVTGATGATGATGRTAGISTRPPASGAAPKRSPPRGPSTLIGSATGGTLRRCGRANSGALLRGLAVLAASVARAASDAPAAPVVSCAASPSPACAACSACRSRRCAMAGMGVCFRSSVTSSGQRVRAVPASFSRPISW